MCQGLIYKFDLRIAPQSMVYNLIIAWVVKSGVQKYHSLEIIPALIQRPADPDCDTHHQPPVLHSKSERDCHICQEDKRKRKVSEPERPISWQLRKGKGGPKKKVTTQGYFCPNERCELNIMGSAMKGLTLW